MSEIIKCIYYCWNYNIVMKSFIVCNESNFTRVGNFEGGVRYGLNPQTASTIFSILSFVQSLNVYSFIIFLPFIVKVSFFSVSILLTLLSKVTSTSEHSLKFLLITHFKESLWRFLFVKIQNNDNVLFWKYFNINF